VSDVKLSMNIEFHFHAVYNANMMAMQTSEVEVKLPLLNVE
jgi:hypothetical protein